jgi:hypothetical protein
MTYFINPITSMFLAFSNRITILLCTMLQNYLLNFMHGERLCIVERNIHLRRMNPKSGTNSNSSTCNDVFQHDSAQGKSKICHLYMLWMGEKNIHINWSSAQKHKSDRKLKLIVLTLELHKLQSDVK